MIKDYFVNYLNRSSDITIDLGKSKIDYRNKHSEDWILNLYDTGKDSLTGGRLYRFEKYLANEETFMLTYGDKVANVNIE